MTNKGGLRALAISIAIVMVASSVAMYSSQKGEKGISEDNKKEGK